MAKRRSRPRAVWVVFNNKGNPFPFLYRRDALIAITSWDYVFDNQAPHTIGKYVLETKRGSRK